MSKCLKPDNLTVSVATQPKSQQIPEKNSNAAFTLTARAPIENDSNLAVRDFLPEPLNDMSELVNNTFENLTHQRTGSNVRNFVGAMKALDNEDSQVSPNHHNYNEY